MINCCEDVREELNEVMRRNESLSAQVAAMTESLQLAEEAITQHNRLATDYRDLLVAAEAQVAELKKALAEASRYEMDHRDKADAAMESAT